jgi:hypothetical protein
MTNINFVDWTSIRPPARVRLCNCFADRIVYCDPNCDGRFQGHVRSDDVYAIPDHAVSSKDQLTGG